MYSRAAVAAASRAAARPPVANPVDLDLSGPGCKRPVEFGEEAPGSDPAPTDVSVSLAPREQDASPPADGAPSLGQPAIETAQSAIATRAAPGAGRTYEATLRAKVPKVTAKLGPRVLALSPDDVFYAFFSSAVLLGRKTVSSVAAHPGVRWSFV